MGPSYPNSTLHFLISILLLSILGTTSAIALPNPNPKPAHYRTYKLRDVSAHPARAANPEDANAHRNVAVVLNSKKDPKSFLKDFAEFLAQYDVVEFIRLLFGGGGNEGEDGAGVKTITVTPTPIGVQSSTGAIVEPSVSSKLGEASKMVEDSSLRGLTATVVETSRRTVTRTRRITTKDPQTTTRSLVLQTLSSKSIITPSTETVFPIETDEPIFSILPIETEIVTTPTMETIEPIKTKRPVFSILPWFPSEDSFSGNASLPTITGIVVEEPTGVIPEVSTDFLASSTPTEATILDNFPWPLFTASVLGNETSLKVISNSPSTRPLILTNPLRPTNDLGWNTTAEPTTTTWINSTSTKYVTVTVLPSPVATTAVSGDNNLVTPVETPKWPNTTYTFTLQNTSSTSTMSILEEASLSLPLIPFPTLPTPPINPFPSFTPTPYVFPPTALKTLRKICQSRSIQTITIPLLDRWYGPNRYPSLSPYPGCTSPNSQQARQAPGLLNCTALGVEIQYCQSIGRRVLLSVKADPPSAVNSNLEYGTRILTFTPLPPLPIGSGGLRNGPLEPFWPNTNWSSIRVGGFPNLFDASHRPAALAQTIFSLFGEGQTERADLRPLGPDTDAKDGIAWLSKPLGEEVVVDGFDVRVPREWKGTYQGGHMESFVGQLKGFVNKSWEENGGKKGGVGDLGADGKAIVFLGWA